MAEFSFTFRAFISYSHTDHDWAVWLHKSLERYRVPRRLTGAEGLRRLGKVFRDEEELAAAAELGPKIDAALKASDVLIVVCSPRSAKSKWVNQEIEAFKRLGREHRVFALILDGSPHGVEDECFPEQLKRRLDGGPAEPLAVDVRKFGREDAALRLIAGMLEVGYDDLRQREVRRRRAERRRAEGLFAAGLILVAAAAVGGWLAWTNYQEVERQQAQVGHARSDLIQTSADAIDATGAHETALLMSLYADPAARRSPATLKYDGVNGYPRARNGLGASFLRGRLQHLFRNPTNLTASVALAPDGKYVLSPSLDYTALVWDAESGEPLTTLRTRPNSQVFSGALSPDGNRIVTGSSDGTAEEWDTSTGKLLTTLQGHTNRVTSVLFSPDGTRILTGSEDSTTRIWDAESGKPVITLSDPSRGGYVYSVAFSPDGKRILTGGETAAWLWDAETGEQLKSFFAPGVLRGLSVFHTARFSPDGKRVVTGSGGADYSARVWDVASGQTIRTFQHNGDVTSAMFSPDGKHVLTGSNDGTARVWNIENGSPLIVLAGPTRQATSAAFTSDGKRILTHSGDSTERVWDAEISKPLVILHAGPVTSAAFSPDSNRIVTGSADKRAIVWDAATGKPLTTLQGHTDEVCSVDFSPDGRRIITGSKDKSAIVWDAATGKALTTLPDRTGSICSAAFSEDGKRILTQSATVQLSDAETGKKLMTLPSRPGQVWSDAALSQDGTRIAAASNMGGYAAQVWDVRSGKLLASMKGRGGSRLALSPDGSRIVTGGESPGTAIVWEAETGKPLIRLRGDADAVLSVAFSQDGRHILTGSFDGKAQLWDAEGGRPLITFVIQTDPIYADPIYAVAFSRDGKRVLIGSYDGTVHVWPIPDYLVAEPSKQVQLSCEKLWHANAPLAFSVADIAQYPVLQGEAEDQDNPGMLVSPCKGVLPPEAFVKQTLPATPH